MPHRHEWGPLYRAGRTPTEQFDALYNRHEDYVRCGCGAIGIRSRHALRRIHVVRDGSLRDALRAKADAWNVSC